MRRYERLKEEHRCARCAETKPYCWKLILCPTCNHANTTRIREASQGQPAPPPNQSRKTIRIAPLAMEQEDAPPMDQIREKLLAHRSFLLERVRTLTADSPAVATLKRRLLELELAAEKIRAVLEETTGHAEEDANLPGIRAKIQAIDTLLSDN